jgi:CheY-like chemotaxis protein
MSKSKNILVVDDDVDLCNSIVSALHRDGYRPTGVTTAREAIFKLTNQQYDCLVLDMRLENETGEEVIEAIRKQKDSQNARTPIVVISGFLDKKLLVKVAKNIQGALVKPFELSKLLELVKKNLA